MVNIGSVRRSSRLNPSLLSKAQAPAHTLPDTPQDTHGKRTRKQKEQEQQDKEDKEDKEENDDKENDDNDDNDDNEEQQEQESGEEHEEKEEKSDRDDDGDDDGDDADDADGDVGAAAVDGDEFDPFASENLEDPPEEVALSDALAQNAQQQTNVMKALEQYTPQLASPIHHLF